MVNSNQKYKDDNVCNTSHADEENCQAGVVEAINQPISSKDAIKKQYRTIIKTLTDTSSLKREHAKQQSERDVVEGLIRQLIAENTQMGLDPDEYTRREADLVERYDAAKTTMTDIEAQIHARKIRRTKLAAFIRALEKQDGLIATFDKQLWNTTIESVTVHSKERMVLRFKGGEV